MASDQPEQVDRYTALCAQAIYYGLRSRDLYLAFCAQVIIDGLRRSAWCIDPRPYTMRRLAVKMPASGLWRWYASVIPAGEYQAVTEGIMEAHARRDGFSTDRGNAIWFRGADHNDLQRALAAINHMEGAA